MHYTDSTGHRLVIAQTDLQGPSQVLEAAEQFYSSRARQAGAGPVLTWIETGRGFVCKPGDALGRTVNSTFHRAGTLIEALKGVESCDSAATFVLMVPPRDAKEPSLALGRQLQTTARKIHSSGAAGLKLVLLFCASPADILTEGLDYGQGEFSETAAAPARSAASAQPTELEKVLRQAVPEFTQKDQAWAFADDPRWTAWIDGLNETDIENLVSKGLHMPSVERLREALRVTQAQFLYRDHALEMMVACAIARANIVFLGPPGTAKSLLVRSFSEALGVRNLTRPIADEEAAVEEALGGKQHAASKRRMFEYLLTRYTTPEELFGGTDINVLLKGNVHARRTTGMLPQAEVAFLDEIFKANSAILNTMLSLTNERIFFNMGQAFKVNLAFIVGASNESPDQAELGALFDRFPIRVPCHPVPGREADVRRLVNQSHKFTHNDTLGTRSRIPRKACLNDIRLLTKVVIGGKFGGEDALPPGQASDLFCDLFLRMRQDYGMSDRTPAQTLRVCRALALLDSKNPDQLEARHLRPFGYVAPNYKEARVLQRFIQLQIQGIDDQAVNLFDES